MSAWPERPSRKECRRKRSADQNPGPGFDRRRVRLLVQQLALGGEEVLLPLLLQMNQRPAPFAECEVLEAGEREEIVF